MYKIGPEKGSLLEQQLAQHGPIKQALELGTFLGYSAIRIARQMPPAGHLVCVEANPDNARVAAKVLALAGVADKVTILRGLAADQLPRAAEELRNGQEHLMQQPGLQTLQAPVPPAAPVDLLFLDHCKDCYLPDLQAAEQLGLVGPGTLVMADNVVYPGAPGFLEYLESSGRYDTQLLRAKYEYEQAWNPNWDLGKEDAMSASLAQGDWSLFGQRLSSR
jgi:predicted O-methyltransferase YrrM